MFVRFNAKSVAIKQKSSASVFSVKASPSIVAKPKIMIVSSFKFFSQEKDESGFHDDFKSIRKKYEEKASTPEIGNSKEKVKDYIQKVITTRFTHSRRLSLKIQ